MDGAKNAPAAVSGCTRRVALVGAAAALWHAPSRAEGIAVPIRLQAELLSKVASYDRNFGTRTSDRVQVLLLTKSGDPDSNLAATEMKNALSSIERIGPLPHDDEIVAFSDANAIADLCRARKASILYLAPGFSRNIEALRESLGSLDLLTVGSLAEYVPNGVVLGFDLVSGRSKLLVNLTQARRQHVEFRAEILKLTKVFE